MMSCESYVQEIFDEIKEQIEAAIVIQAIFDSDKDLSNFYNYQVSEKASTIIEKWIESKEVRG